MYELRITSQFAAAHQLGDLAGGCENLHGHNWKVDVYVMGENLGKDGVLIDFRLVKETTRRVLDELDHRFLNETDPFRTLSPSSENIARYVYEALSRELNNPGIKVSRITAWESDSSCATYSEP
jgi:6-pyruvoyltetrahydropterin/6-carboxytetrahydropterin synthase